MSGEFNPKKSWRRYFISYNWAASNGSGFGATEVSMPSEIKTLDDVTRIADLIKDAFADKGRPDSNIVIINWKKFDS